MHRSLLCSDRGAGILAACLLAMSTIAVACGPVATPALATRHPFEDKHDLEYSATHLFRVRLEKTSGAGEAGKRPEQVMVKSTTEVTLVPLRQWVLGQAFFSVHVPWHTSLESFAAYRGGERLPAGHILDTVPSVPNVFLHSSRLVRVFSPPRQLGEPVTYRYTRVHRDVRFLPLVGVPNVDYLKRFEVVIHHPASVEVELRWWSREGEPAPALARTVSGDQATSRLLLRNLRALPPRRWDPLDDPRAMLWLTLRRGSAPLHPVTPEAFVRWMRSLYDRAGQLGAKGQALARSLVAGLDSDRARARAIYDFVRREVRYIADVRGEGAVTPRPADTILERRWGDCKDKTNLIIALARQVGLTVDPVLVATMERPPMQGAVHPGMFDHAIASVRLGDERVFMDPTATTVPFGSLPAPVEDAVALVLDPADPRELRLPVGDHGPEISGTVTMSPKEPTEARAALTIRGGLVHAIALFRQKPGQDGWEERVERLLTGILPDLSFQGLRLVQDAGELLRVEARVDMRRMVLKAGSRLYVRRTPRRPCQAGLQPRLKDQAPLMLPLRLSLDLALHIPAGPGPLPPGSQVRHRAEGVAWFESLAESHQGRVILRLRQGRQRRYLTGQAKHDYLRFCAAARAEAEGWFTVERGW